MFPVRKIVARIQSLQSISGLYAVVLGGLLVLKSGEDRLSADKVLYALVATGVIASAAVRLKRSDGHCRQKSLFYPLLVGSGALYLLVFVSLPVAIANGTDLSSWLRDAGPYLLLATVPLLAWDVDRELRYHERAVLSITVLLVLAGSAATASFVLDFLGRRRIADVQTEGVILGSFLFGAALFVYALARGQDRVALRGRWTILGVAIFVFLFFAGTRSALILLAGAFAVLAVLPPFTWRGSRQRSLIMLGAIACGAAVIIGVLSMFEPSDSGVGRASARLRSIPSVLTDPWSDESVALRRAQWGAAWQIVQDHPVLGVGPGYRFEWPYPYAAPFVRSGYVIDSPVGFAAKFGLLGVVALLIVAAGYAQVVRRLWAPRTRTAATAALLGFLVITVTYVPLGVPFEDRGFSFGLLLLLALAGAAERTGGASLRRTIGDSSA